MLKTIAAGKEDERFLHELYVSTRHHEVSSWGWNERMIDSFLEMQRTAQMKFYEAQYPDAKHRIVYIEHSRIGRIITCNRSEELILVDISLLPAFRGQGIGTRLIRDLQKEAVKEQKPVRLSVIKGNPAQRLYERLKFFVVADNGLYLRMEWRE